MSEENKPVANTPVEKTPATQTYVFIDSPKVLLMGETGKSQLDAEKAKEYAGKIKKGDKIFIASSTDADGNNLRDIGTIAEVYAMGMGPDGSLIVAYEAQSRGKIASKDLDQNTVTAEEILPTTTPDIAVNTYAEATHMKFEEFVRRFSQGPGQVRETMIAVTQVMMQAPAALADDIVPRMALSEDMRRKFLETLDPVEQLKLAMNCIIGATASIEISQRTKAAAEKQQKEYYLRTQRDEIDKELGDDDKAEIDKLEKQVKEASMPKEAEDACLIEIKRMRKLGGNSQEAGVSRTYVERLVALPWAKLAPLNCDLNTAEAILDAEHYGMEKAKERIIEFLASQKTATESKGGILCLVGPPGVGKTSIGKSVAKATGREFVHLALGGVNDEAALRGHRRTYIGAVPGNIITELAKIKTKNPLIMLDEVDKMAQGGTAKGADPTAALLELLDPEQNGKFRDHYVGVPYDLSQAMFMVTANYLENIPPAVRDRMEIIQLPAYTEEEKLQIAKKHLLRKAMAEGGVTADQFKITDDAIALIISDYTAEAGVRKLFQRLKALSRKVNVKIQKGLETSVELTAENLQSYAGIPRPKGSKVRDRDMVGEVNGLAYMEIGGDVLPIQCVKIESPNGGITSTGQLGDVMKESVTVAYDLVRSKARELGIDPAVFSKNTFRVHFPAGAIPKDGPSAGLAIMSVIVSAATGIPANRLVAMTGEVNLMGDAMPIGGVAQKLAGAYAAGAKKVLLPEANRRDESEISAKVKNGLEIVYVNNYVEVLQHILTSQPQPLTIRDVFTNNAGQEVKAGKFVQVLLTQMERDLQDAFQKVSNPAVATEETRQAFLKTAAEVKQQAKDLSGSFEIAGGRGFELTVTSADGFTPLPLSLVVKKVESSLQANDSAPPVAMPIAAQANMR